MNLQWPPVKAWTRKFSLEGCLFDGKLIKLTKIMDYQVDVSPNGAMLLVHNKDIPGVVGRVGTILGESGVNIAEYILSRPHKKENPISIIKVDHSVNEKCLKKLNEIDEIIEIRQFKI